MLYAFQPLLCLKLSQHNRLKPTLVLRGLLDFLVPLRRLHVRNGGSDPWLTTPCIIAARRLRDRLHRKHCALAALRIGLSFGSLVIGTLLC